MYEVQYQPSWARRLQKRGQAATPETRRAFNLAAYHALLRGAARRRERLRK
jgi:hypothetical protein